MYYWANKKFVSSCVVIDEMPIDSIDKFYINNNCRVWESLIKKSNIEEDENIGLFFKLCYVLGLFSNSVKIRDRAVKFI